MIIIKYLIINFIFLNLNYILLILYLTTELSIVISQAVSGVLVLSRDKQRACHVLIHNSAQALSDNHLISL